MKRWPWLELTIIFALKKKKTKKASFMLIWEKRRPFTPDEEDLAWLCVITITVHFYSDNFIPGWSESNWQSSHTHNSPWDSKKNLPYATGHNKSFSWSDPTTHALGSFYVFRQLYVLPYMTFGSSKNNFFDGNDKVWQFLVNYHFQISW